MQPDVKGKTYLVVGLARSGCAAGALLRRHGAHVVGVDDGDEASVARRWELEGLNDLAPGAFDELHTGGLWPETNFDGIVISPAVRPDHPELLKRAEQTSIIGELELGARYCAATCVAVTGTNGKSTTTELVAHLVRRGGLRAEALGNLGRPLCLVADTLPPDAVAVLEVSSFQLETISTFAPQVGLVLNLAPDHLDRYADLDAYFAAKQCLAGAIPANGVYVTATDCALARCWATAGRRILFGDENDEADVFYRDGVLHAPYGEERRPLLPRIQLALQSPPNLVNALAAVAVGGALDIEPEALAEGLRTFRGLAHRHELVARRGGVKFINDSKATNVHAACAGLQGYPEDLVLILGGSAKGEDYAPLQKVMEPVRHVILIGAEGPAIGEALADIVPTSPAETLDEAVALAADLADTETPAAVLLSPACASFDMFANYRQRGEAFREAARKAGADILT